MKNVLNIPISLSGIRRSYYLILLYYLEFYQLSLFYQLLLHTPLHGRFNRIALLPPARITPHHIPRLHYVPLQLPPHPPLQISV